MTIDGTAEVARRPEEETPAGALDALRLHLAKQSGADPADQTRWRVDYLAALERVLRGAGLGEPEIAPLRDIGEAVARHGDTPDHDDDDAWVQHYAKACAEIGYLILTGTEESEAAQRVARNLVARGVPLPAKGGDARGWKRLLIYRDRIRNNQVPEPVAETFRAETKRLKALGA